MLSFKRVHKADKCFDDSRAQNLLTSISVGWNRLFTGTGYITDNKDGLSAFNGSSAIDGLSRDAVW